jgi:hypothetical protein
VHGDSFFALASKAAILFHRAAHLTGQWSPSTQYYTSTIFVIKLTQYISAMTHRDQMAYDAAARSVNVLIESFRANLAPIPRYNTTHDPNIRTIILTHALVDAASIKLHWIFAYALSTSKEICLSAARNMVDYGDLNLQDLGYMNPIIGVSSDLKLV